MALVIETGAGVAGANSYASVLELKTFAGNRGLEIPAVTGDLEKALVLACDKLETYRFKGAKVDPLQALAWPRSEVYLEDATEPLAEDFIPDRLKMAQCQFAVEVANGTDLQPTGDGREIVMEKVDVLETKYAERGAGAVSPQFTKAEGFLSSLLENGGGMSLKTLRL